MKSKIENIKRKIAAPYVDDAVKKDRDKLLKFFQGSRQLERVAIVKRLDSIKYDKPWSKGTTLDQAFDLAIHEAIQIVESELS